MKYEIMVGIGDDLETVAIVEGEEARDAKLLEVEADYMEYIIDYGYDVGYIEVWDESEWD